jgi:hypothetical protein
MRLLFAAALPLLYWDGTLDTAKRLSDAHIVRIGVPPDKSAGWNSVAGLNVEAIDRAKLITLPAPGVNYRYESASATSEPWLDTNAWQFLRSPSARFYYEAPGRSAALSAAEAFMWDAAAVVHTDSAGLPDLAKMTSFLQTVEQPALPARVNIGFIDDGSSVAAEVMKLLVRRNLLFQIVRKRAPSLELNVEIGSKDYTREQARDPYFLAQKIRADLGDDKRLVRIFGSQVTVARLAGDTGRARLHLLNYAGPSRPAVGVRVRVKGPYRSARPAIYGNPTAQLQDVSTGQDAIEFTVKQLDLYAVVDLSK